MRKFFESRHVPEAGKYCDAIVVDNYNNKAYIYDEAGTWTDFNQFSENADWLAVSGPSAILNKPTFSTVAFTGEYGDILNTPPEINLIAGSNVVITGTFPDITIASTGGGGGGGGAVDSVNGFTGTVVLNPDNLDDTSTVHKFFTQAERDKLAALVADGSITAVKLATNAVTTVKIANAAVTASKIDFGGAGTGVWWEEIKRKTLDVAGDTISLTSIPARKYYKVIIKLFATGGTINDGIRFNNDSGNNYAWQLLNAQNATVGAAANTPLNYLPVEDESAANNAIVYSEFEVVNESTREKPFIGHSNHSAPGVANVPKVVNVHGKWANTASQINRIDVINLFGTGNFAIGSEVIVLGHN